MALPALFDPLDDPRADHQQRDRSQQRQLIRLEDAAGIDVEEERRQHHRGQPARLDDFVAECAQTARMGHGLISAI